MVVAKIYVDGTRAIVTSLSCITMGMQGAQVEVEYNGMWSGLNRTAVFAGSVVKDVVNAGELLTIPAELTEKPRHQLRIGFYGVDGDGKVVIPTLWATLGIVQDATDPSGDTSTDPSLPVWAQLIKMIEDINTGVIPPELIENAVVDYLEKHPVQSGATEEEAAQIQQNKEDIEKLTTDKLDADRLPEAVNEALAQAKASGEFKGDPGDDYVLTEADKQEIAGMVEVSEDVFELIETITLTEDVTAIEKTLPFACKSVYVHINITASSNTYYNANISTYWGPASNLYYTSIGLQNYLKTNTNAKGWCAILDICGLLLAVSSDAQSYAPTGVSTNMNDMPKPSVPLERYRIGASGTDKIPAGSTFEIYGVRA